MRVLVTRAPGQANRLAERLQERGLAPVVQPLIETVPVGGTPLRAGGYDWLVLTSRAAVDAFMSRREGALPRIAAIGPGTAEALRAHGLEPALVPSRSSQEGLLAELPRPAGRVLFAGAEDARTLLADELDADVVVLYRTVRLPVDRLEPADLAVLASASAARAYAAAGGTIPCVSIGPQTTAAAHDAGLVVIAEAESADLDGLVEAVTLAASRLRSSPS